MKRVLKTSGWIALVLVALALILVIALAQTDRRGEEFTEEQRRFLTSQEPRGVFVSRATFRTCRDGKFTQYHADWGWEETGLLCWSHLLPVVPSFLPVK